MFTGFLLTVLAVGFAETIVKPLGIWVFQRLTAPAVDNERVRRFLDRIDLALPELVQDEGDDSLTVEELKEAFKLWSAEKALVKSPELASKTRV